MPKNLDKLVVVNEKYGKGSDYVDCKVPHQKFQVSLS